MTILKDAEAVVDMVVPQKRWAQIAAHAALAGIVLAVLAFVIWSIFVNPGHQRQAAEQAKVDAKLGTASSEAAVAAIPQINDATRQKVEIEVKVQKGQSDVRAAQDAGVGIGGVSDAVRRNLCLHADLYAADPACQPLHEDPAGIGITGPDAGGTAGPD